MDARAQRREYNDLYRAHQATTTQDALKMEMMLSMLAQNNSPAPPAQSQSHVQANAFAQQQQQQIAGHAAGRHRENYGNARQGQRMPKAGNNQMHNGPPSLSGSGSSVGGGGGGGGMGHVQHAAGDMLARPAETMHNAYPKAQTVSQDGFRYQSPHLQLAQPAQSKFISKLDVEFAERRRMAQGHVPGWCAGQILQSPVDAWGLQAILLQIRGTAAPVSAATTEPAELAPWNDRRRPSPHKSVAFSAAVVAPPKAGRLSVPSATSDESAPYDYFDEAAEHADPPLTPTTSAYSEAPAQNHNQAQNVPVPCIVRISGSDVHSVAGANHLVRLIAALILESPRILHAALAPAEPLSSGAHLGAFVPSPYDVSVKLLFVGRGPGDEFAVASDIFQSLGGCILVKAVADYEIEHGDEVVVDNISHRRRR